MGPGLKIAGVTMRWGIQVFAFSWFLIAFGQPDRSIQGDKQGYRGNQGIRSSVIPKSLIGNPSFCSSFDFCLYVCFRV